MQLLPLLCAFLLAILPASATPDRPGDGGPDLAYLEIINSQHPPHDPQLLFLLMGRFASAQQHERGAAFFTARLQQFDHELNDTQRALYLTVIALLRAQHAGQVSFFHRIGYVNETVDMLERARKLTGGRVFVVNWASAIVDAQLPSLLNRRQKAHEELDWCISHASEAPHAGWLREIYRQQARLAQADGKAAAAQAYLKRSGYPDINLPITLLTPFAEETDAGHRFSPSQIREVVPQRVYVLSGFEFTEFYFVVSDDGRELIGIDAGTRPDSARAAYEALRAFAHHLPPLTTIFITHSHWDHIGGHKYFRSLNPQLQIYARSNYRDELARDLAAPANFNQPFFGAKFQEQDVRSFKPDVPVDSSTSVVIGGTRIELVPIHGGETQDAMFINLPGLKTTFVGDFIMPYLGAPFVHEGDLPGLYEAIGTLSRLQPANILHGHEPLTRMFNSTLMLEQVRDDLEWLESHVENAMRRGVARADVHQANLVPPALLSGAHDTSVPYLVLREHVIDRIFSQRGGYWQADLQGIDHISRADQADLFLHYLGRSENQILDASKQMIADGKYELAARLLDACRERLGKSKEFAATERAVYLRLMEKNQNDDPFKFILYANKAGMQVPPVQLR
ncbi:MBL fold metallo-hydrolase [Pseudoduganella eburnea]|uniref:MBL fold metallo-hydrolase n=1 Tax=Massilia eburnea TaxID=1776165 RepID=A0A6L6QBI5_9BURK|nr:MBL fold metallo-hydrolase [Massilia eburnea]MTW09146.1 MBL fold metallo-hydrolase [Massilia eburnea]